MGADAACKVTNAIKPVARRDARCCKHDVFARREFVSGVDLIWIRDAHTQHPFDVGFLAFTDQTRLHDRRVIDQLTLEVTAEAFHRRRTDHPFRSRTNSDQRMDSGICKPTVNGRTHVTITDQVNPSTSGPDFFDQIIVAFALHDDDYEFIDRQVEAVRQNLQVFGCRLVNIDLTACRRRRSQLLHVEVRSRKQSAFFSNSQNCNRPLLTIGAKVGAFTRIDSDVDFRARTRFVARPDFFTNEEHRRIVTLAFTDDNPTAHVNFVHAFAHRFHGSFVCTVFVALTGQFRRCDRGLFDDLNNL